MTKIVIYLFFILIWCGFTNNLRILNIVFAIAITAFIARKVPNIKINIFPLIRVVAYTFMQLLLSSFYIAWDVITPKVKNTPHIIRYQLQCTNNWQILLLMILVSVTPGTICIDVNEDKTIMTIHAMFDKVNEKVISEKLEKYILRVFTNG